MLISEHYLPRFQLAGTEGVKGALTKESTTSAVRNKYTAQFKEQVLERAEHDGIPQVAQDLGLAESLLYSWRAKRRQTGRQSCEDQKLQQAEMVRLKRENARLEEIKEIGSKK
ncbi:MAG: transposase [Methylobacter sp.]